MRLCSARAWSRYLVDGADLVEWQSDDAALLCEGLENGLANPPDGIGNKLKASGLVELLGGLYQSHVTFVDKVWQGESLVLILLGNADDEAEVGPHQLVEGTPVALAYLLGEFHFLLNGKQRLTAYFLQILVERGTVATRDALCNFKLSHIL